MSAPTPTTMSNTSKIRIGRGLKAAVKALMTKPVEPVHFAAAGRQIVCAHCGGAEFDGRDGILLNTRGATFVNLDWLNAGVSVLTCRQCGRIEWFARPPQPIE